MFAICYYQLLRIFLLNAKLRIIIIIILPFQPLSQLQKKRCVTGRGLLEGQVQ